MKRQSVDNPFGAAENNKNKRHVASCYLKSESDSDIEIIESKLALADSADNKDNRIEFRHKRYSRTMRHKEKYFFSLPDESRHILNRDG